MDSFWKEERMLVKAYESCEDNQNLPGVFEERSRILAKMAEVNTRASNKSCALKACLFLEASLQNTKCDSGKILQELRILHRKILRLSSAKSLSTDLHAASQAIRQKVSVIEQRIQTALSNEAADNDSEAQYDKEKFEKYAARLKNVVTGISDSYIDILKEASRECINILGEPPCKFSHFALGAHGNGYLPVTRDLLTAIVLENSIKKKDSYATSLEYFNWYAIIFQILTCSGTLNRSHQTLSVQNRKHGHMYEGERKTYIRKKLFNNPITCLGDAAKLICFNVNMDMVKTVDQMVKMFSPSNSHNANELDITIKLARTQHIGGNESIHKKLKKRIRKIIYAKESEGDYFKHIVFQQFSRTKFQDFSFRRSLPSKHTLEVPDLGDIGNFAFELTNTLGHLAKIEKNSAFAICQSLMSKGFIDDKAGLSLNIALAISSEMLMNQTASLFQPDCTADALICTNMKKQKLIKLVFVLPVLQTLIDIVMNSAGNIALIKGKPMEVDDLGKKAEILCHFEWYQEALDILEGGSARCQDRANPAFEHFMKGLCLTKIKRLDHANEVLEQGLAALSSLPEADQSKIFHYMQYLLGVNYLRRNHYLKAVEHLVQAKNAFQSRDELFVHRGDELYLEVLDGLAESRYQLEQYEAACVECVGLVVQYDSLAATRLDIIYNALTRQADSLVKLGNYGGCIDVLEKAMSRASCDENVSEIHSLFKVKWSIKLADCHFRLNQIENAEKYCKDVIQSIDGADADNSGAIAQIRLISAQCYLWQGRLVKASKDACDAITTSLQAHEMECNKLYIIQTGVTILSRSVSPITALQNKVGAKGEDHCGRQTLSLAMTTYNILCEQTVFTGNQLQRDKSVLFRVIQTGLFRANRYEYILDLCRSAAERITAEESRENSLSRIMYDVIIGDEHILENCNRDSEYLCEAAKFCNVRDAFSISGSIIVFSGCLNRCGFTKDSDEMTQAMSAWLSDQSEITKISFLHSSVKIAKYLVENFLARTKSLIKADSRNNRQIPILNFISDIFAILKAQPHCPNDLVQETAILKANAATCWMKVQDYEGALSLLNDALELQEQLALDISSIVYIDSNAIIQDIGVCLAKLGRWQEADSYLNRKSAIKERRRKSRAYEDYSMIHARVKSARCSFSLGNYQEAVFMASTAFQDGLIMESIDNHDDSMISAVGIVLKSTLAVSAHAEVQANKSLIKTDVLAEILNRATNLRATLEEKSELLGGVYAETVESFYYACGNCLLALESYKQAMKSFKKSLKIMKQKQIQFLELKQPIILNIAKCLIGQNKFKTAEKYLNRFLEMDRNKTRTTLHTHPSHAYLLLSICSLKRKHYKTAYKNAAMSLNEAIAMKSDVLSQQITKECAQIFLQLMNIEIKFLDLD